MRAPSLSEFAPAKVNLTLRVLGRRADGYHELDSIVAFADVGDTLTLMPHSGPPELKTSGPTSAAAGPADDNLVIKAARALAGRVPGLVLGRFSLAKRLPVAAGLGGGSSDAAAALRLLARANGLAADDPRIAEAARATGADVPVCLAPKARIMRGIGERLSAPVGMAALPAILVNPRVAVPTRDVFVGLAAGPADAEAAERAPLPADLARAIEDGVNDLEAPALKLQPVIGDVLRELGQLRGCRLTRMSGSGATCFGLFTSMHAAREGAMRLRAAQHGWWVRATMLA